MAESGPALGPGPQLMAVLNVTPDSFSDGGAWPSPAAVVARARQQIAAGATVLDVGAESTRPHASPVSAAEELARLLPAVEALVAARLGVPLSVDTRRPAVAAAALARGAAIVNDVGGLTRPDMVALVADRGATAIAMHGRGTPATMDALATYGDVVAEVAASLSATAARVRAAGVPAARLWLDPGLGFAKTTAHSLALLGRLAEVVALGHPVVVGPSRKRFLGAATGRAVADRDRATAAACALAVAAGARMVRVHDVGAVVDAVALAAAARAAAGGYAGPDAGPDSSGPHRRRSCRPRSDEKVPR